MSVRFERTNEIALFGRVYDERQRIDHRTVIVGVKAPGLLGFVYRKLGKSNGGNAILTL